MRSQAIDQDFSPSVLGTAQVFYCPQPLASGNRTLELFPVPWEKYSGLLPGYTLNNCILYPPYASKRGIIHTCRCSMGKMTQSLKP